MRALTARSCDAAPRDERSHSHCHVSSVQRRRRARLRRPRCVRPQSKCGIAAGPAVTGSTSVPPLHPGGRMDATSGGFEAASAVRRTPFPSLPPSQEEESGRSVHAPPPHYAAWPGSQLSPACAQHSAQVPSQRRRRSANCSCQSACADRHKANAPCPRKIRLLLQRPPAGQARKTTFRALPPSDNQTAMPPLPLAAMAHCSPVFLASSSGQRPASSGRQSLESAASRAMPVISSTAS